MVELKKITLLSNEMKECIALNVAPEQEDYVYTNAITLALAYRNNIKDIVWECRAIYASGKMVGLITYQYFIDPPCYKETCYRIRPLMVDKGQLGKGYEEAAIRKLLEEIRTKPQGDAAAVFVTYDPKEEDMPKLYQSIGFTKTDITLKTHNGDNIIARMSL